MLLPASEDANVPFGILKILAVSTETSCQHDVPVMIILREQSLHRYPHLLHSLTRHRKAAFESLRQIALTGKQPDETNSNALQSRFSAVASKSNVVITAMI